MRYIYYVDVAYAIKDPTIVGKFTYELFTVDHYSCGYQTDEYVVKHKIPVRLE